MLIEVKSAERSCPQATPPSDAQHSNDTKIRDVIPSRALLRPETCRERQRTAAECRVKWAAYGRMAASKLVNLCFIGPCSFAIWSPRVRSARWPRGFSASHDAGGIRALEQPNASKAWRFKAAKSETCDKKGECVVGVRPRAVPGTLKCAGMKPTEGENASSLVHSQDVRTSWIGVGGAATRVRARCRFGIWRMPEEAAW